MGGPAPTDTISDAEWAKIVDAAKKEGQITCYCWDWSNNPYRGAWVVKKMKELYGIDVQILGLSGAISSERIKTEARAGKFLADVYASMASYNIGAVEPVAGLLQPIDNLPVFKSANDPNVRYYNPLITRYTANAPTDMQVPGAHYQWNTRVFPEERLPKKWQDLTDPYFKEKPKKLCQGDPSTSSTLDYLLWRHFMALGYPDWWPDVYYDLFVKQNDMFVYGILGQPAPLLLGECGLTPSEWGGSGSNVKKAEFTDKVTWTKAGSFADQPYPIMWATSFAYSMPAKQPHPNAAKLLLNWWYGKEALEGYTKDIAVEVVNYRGVPNPIEQKYSPARPVTTHWMPDAKWFVFEQYSFASRVAFNLVKQGMSRDAFKKTMRDTSMNYWGQYPPPPYTILSED